MHDLKISKIYLVVYLFIYLFTYLFISVSVNTIIQINRDFLGWEQSNNFWTTHNQGPLSSNIMNFTLFLDVMG